MRKLSLVGITLTLLFGLAVSFAGWRAQAGGESSARLPQIFSPSKFNKSGARTAATLLVDCPTNATLTQSTSQTLSNNVNVGTCSAGGGEHLDTSFWRAFDLTAMGVTGSFKVSHVQIGVEHAVGNGGAQPITVRIHQQTSGTFPAGTRTQLSATNFNVPDAATGTVLSIPVTVTEVPAGAVMIIEIFTPSGFGLGNSFRIGANNEGQTAPSYRSSTTCNRPIEAVASHIVMNVLSGISVTNPAATIGPPNVGSAKPSRKRAAPGLPPSACSAARRQRD